MNASLEQEEVLDILNRIQKTPEITQRTLSSNLGISLGKINFLVSDLARKGLIKIKRFKNSKNKAAYLYMLTPYGIKQKAHITHRFLKRKIEEYNHLEKEIERLKMEVKELQEDGVS